ncbi:CD59 glycoprotein [Clarias gariepinus]|uniref:CD59 glycoprotein n=1 Tax=Clarias gariepinus TaxID=13013 RepID=UPI00234D872C|nr:CD59 glycoprotein [Clarias gariepinus]XP_053349344.1 CD59 glycoprotein [Clarias gariepinus]
MRVYVQVGVVFVLALIGLGSALRCYTCTDYSGSCTTTGTCGGQQDGCLTLVERNGKTYRQCIRYSECEYSNLGTMFSSVSNFKYNCCTKDLCNGASVSAAKTSVIALLLSLALFWWCIF